MADVLTALRGIGIHSHVAVEPGHLQVSYGSPTHVHVELSLIYDRERPMCCQEPSCYVAFLGWRKADVPPAIQRALELAESPRVSMTVHVMFPPGYRHAGVPWAAKSFTFEMEPHEWVPPRRVDRPRE